MAELGCSELVQRNHAALLGAAMPSLHFHLAKCNFLVRDKAEGLAAGMGGIRQVLLDLQDQPSIESIGRGNMVLSYQPSDIAGAAAALLAVLMQPTLPIAYDPETQALYALATRIATCSIPVFIEGPTGTGKEVLARHIHNSSDRADGPFVAINCAAMPETMLEAMLFGHCKGAFTGASESGQGFFRAADGGTLLLDEIGEMPLALQAKLLRALQEGEVTPIGSTKPIKVDTRIVASTNRNIPSEVAAGRFREDLYYRLNVFPLAISSLKERQGDIAPLSFAMFLRHMASPIAARWINSSSLKKLAGHAWPGNVRELENVLRRAMVLAGDATEIRPEHIQFDAAVRVVESEDLSNVALPPSFGGNETRLSEISFRSEADAITETLARNGGHRGRTARQLGISERTLRYRLANMREAGLAIGGGAQ